MNSYLTAYDLRGGYYTYRDPISVRCVAQAASPAVGFLAEVAVETGPEAELFDIRWFVDGQQRFAGFVDRQSLRLDAGGLTLCIEARSAGSYLLDNEALPAHYENCTLAAFGERYFTGYGLYRYGFDPGRSLPHFTVRKGCSDWQAVCEFCRLAYGRTPYLTEAGELRLLPHEGGREHLLSNRAPDGLRFLSLEVSEDRSEVLSRVCIRDRAGYYPTKVDNPVADYYKIRRKRYLIPPSQYEERADEDAYLQIRRSMAGKHLAEAVLAGLPDVQVGDRVQIDAPGFASVPLVVRARSYLVEGDGVRTVLQMWDYRFDDLLE